MVKNKLQEKFPLIRTREEILAEIQANPPLWKIYMSWEEADRKKFMDMMSGARGVKMK